MLSLPSPSLAPSRPTLSSFLSSPSFCIRTQNIEAYSRSSTMNAIKRALHHGFTVHIKSGSLFVYALGLCIMNGKQVIMWNKGIAIYGLWLYFVSLIVTGIIYIVLTYSYSEMVSIVPFSGGCYGYVRCTLGPTLGYIAGVMEGGKYILYSSMCAYLMGTMFFEIYGFAEHWLPVLWLGFYAMAISLQVFGSRAIWWSWGVLAVGSFTTQLIFMSGSMRYGKVSHLEWSSNGFDGDGVEFLRSLGYSAFLFTGIDAVRTCSNDQLNKVVPVAMVRIMIFTILIALGTVFAARAYVSDPNTLLSEAYPYTVGLKICLKGVNDKVLPFFSLAGITGSFLGFLYGGGRQIRSMACSGLLPSWLATVQKDNTDDAEVQVQPQASSGLVVEYAKGEEEGCRAAEAVSGSGGVVKRAGGLLAVGDDMVKKETKPVMAILLCALLSYVLLVAGYYKVNTFFLKIVHMGGLQTCLEVIGMMAAHVVFATRFKSMDRGFKSPFGLWGSLLVIAFFIMYMTVVLFYDNDNKGLGITLMLYFVGSMIYYWWVANKRQFFSKEEQEKFMKAYIVNANQRRRTGSSRRSSKKSQRSSLGGVLGVLASMRENGLSMRGTTAKSTEKAPLGGSVKWLATDSGSSYIGNHKIVPSSPASEIRGRVDTRRGEMIVDSQD